MLPLAAAALAVSLIQPERLQVWRWQIEAQDWTWRATSPDRAVEVFTRPVKHAATPQVWVRTERFEGRWQSQLSRLALDCRAGKADVLQSELYSGMNLSGEVRDASASASAPPEALLKPILRTACGS